MNFFWRVEFCVAEKGIPGGHTLALHRIARTMTLPVVFLCILQFFSFHDIIFLSFFLLF